MIPDIKQEILLIAEPGREKEAVIRLSRVGYDYAVGYLEGGFESWLNSKKEVDAINRISARKLEKIYTYQPFLIDVRRNSEFESEHVKGAINIPLNEINQHLAEIPKDTKFYLYCAGGYRSMIAASILKARGWEDFADIEGGFSEISETAIPKTEYVCPTTLL